MFFYLIVKYNDKLNQLTSLKKTSKKKYQKKTCNYENIGLRVAPAIHQILKNFSDSTGFSISAIVGFLIEWEFNDNVLEIHGTSFNTLSVAPFLTFETVITEMRMEIRHQYLIKEERVEETFIFDSC
ncbi:MAG: hypothetical protein ACK4GR_06155 [bacterium]